MYFKNLLNHLKIQRTAILHNEKDKFENYLPLKCKISNQDHIGQFYTRIQTLFEFKSNSEGIINLFLNQKLEKEQFIAFISGFKGGGKSMTIKLIESYLWEKCYESKKNIIPIILSKIDNIQKTDELDLLEYTLQISYSFTSDEIQYLKEQIQQKNIQLVFIIDSFELEHIQKLNITNFQNTWGNSKIIIMIKELKMNSQEIVSFPNNLSLQLQILPFSQEQTMEYLNLHFYEGLKMSIQTNDTFFKLSAKMLDEFILSLQKIFKQNYETQWDGQLNNNQLTLINETIQNSEIIKDEQSIKEFIIIIKEHLKQNWFPIKYQNQILKFKLDSLAQNPAILKILINILPQFDSHYQLETFDFYEDFFSAFLGQEQQLFYQQKEQQNYINEQIQYFENKYFQQIFGNDNYLHNKQNETQNISLLEDNLDSFSKAQDYFIAKLIYKFISLYPFESIFSDNEDYCLLLQQENKNLIQNSLQMVPEMFYWFGRIKFSKPIIQEGMQLFKQKFQNDIKIKEKLLNMIKASSVVDNYEQIAGNAFYVLRDICPYIENQYFANIRITHSKLQNMIFIGCEFSGSIMNNVDISSTKFIGCGMNNVKWENMITSLMNISDGQINQFQILHKEKILAIVSKERLINFLYLKQSKKLQYQLKTKESISLIASIFNGYILAICDQQNEILIWNTTCRKILRRIKTKQKKTLQFNFSKTGKFLASQSAHYNIKVWNLKYKCVMVSQECKLFVFHPNEKYLVLLNEKDKILQYFIKQKKFGLELEGNKLQGTKKIDFSTDGKHFFTITEYVVNIWDWKNQQLLQTIFGHCQSYTFSFNSKCFARSNQYCLEIFKFVNDKFILENKITYSKKNIVSLNYSPQSHILIILEAQTRSNQKLYILDTKKMDSHDESTLHNYFQNPLKFSSDNYLIASGGKQLNIFNQKNRNFINLDDEEYDKVQSLAFSKDGLMLAIAIQNSNVHLLNVREEKIIAKFEQKCNFSQVTFSDDNQFLAIGSIDSQSKLWEFKQNQTILIPSTNQITFLSTKHLIAICDQKKFIRFYNFQNNKKLSKFFGSKKQIQAMKFSIKSKLLAIGGNEKDVILWNIFKQKLIRKMNHHKNCINSVSFSSDGKMIASGSDDNNIILWDNTCGVVHKVLKGHKNSVQVVTFKEDEKILASGGIDMLVIIWNTTNGQIIQIFEGHQSQVTCLTFSPVDQILVSGGKDKQILFWDINQLRTLKKMQTLKKSIKFLAFSSDCKKLAICNEENLVSIWNIITTENNYSFSLLYIIDKKFRKINSIAFSPDCQSLVIGGNQFELVQWLFKTGKKTRFQLKKEMNIIDLVFTKDGTGLAISGDNFSLFLLNVISFKLIKKIIIHQKQVKSVLFTPDDQYLVLSSKEIITWNIKTSEQKQIIQNNGKNNGLEILGFILDGKIIVFVSQKQQIQKINFTLFQSGEIIKSIVNNGLSHILSPDGIQIAVLKSKSQICKLQINRQKLQNQIQKDILLKKFIQKDQFVANLQKFDLRLENDQIKKKKSKKHLDKLQSIQSIASTLDGQYFSTSSQNGTICLWQTSSGQFISQIHIGDLSKQWKMQFSPNNKLLLFYSLNDVFCYTLDEKEKRCLFQKYHGKFHLIIFSQNDSLIATLYSDIQDYIILWNLQEEKPLLVIQDYSTTLPSLVFSPDGQSIVSGSIDSSIYFLDIQTGEQTLQLDGMNEASKYLSFSKCGKYLISQEISNKLYLWNVDQQQLLQQFESQKFQISQFLFKSAEQIYLLGIQSKTFFLFDLLNTKIIQQFQSHSDVVQSVAISNDSENMMFIYKDSSIRIWNILEGKLIKKIESSQFDFVSQQSYDQKLIAIENLDNKIEIWDAEMENLLQQLDGHSDKINVQVFSQDNTILVSGSSDNTVIVWNLQDVQDKKILKGHTDSVLSISITADNKIIASGGRDNTVRIYKIDEDNHSIIFKGHNQLVSCLQFSKDGQYLASGSYDYSVILWSITQQQLIKIFKFHKSKIISVKFSPKECFLISESEDETQITWNIKTGQFSSLKNLNQQLPLIQQNQSLSIKKPSLIQAEIYSPNQLDIIQILNNGNN